MPAPRASRAGSSHRSARPRARATPSSSRQEARALVRHGQRALDVLPVVERRERGLLGEQVQVERMARALEIARQLAVGQP